MESQGWWQRLELDDEGKPVDEITGVTRWRLAAVQLCFPGFIKPGMSWAANLTVEPGGFWLGGFPT